ncbi:MAG: enoyl-CoA hydratase-related protein [Rubrivivax sp.]
MSEATVLVTQTGAVRTLTLNRPAALNALTTAMHGELMGALNDAAADPATRCLLLTGNGRGFCAGQDLADPAMAEGADVGGVVLRLYKPLVQRLRSLPLPVVCAVNGVAAGAGANIALSCDIVLATRSASFVQAFSKIGLIPDAGGTWLLPRLVGRAQAIGLAMLGDKLPAADAERLGLIWRCVDDGALAADALTLAQRLAAMPTRALVATRLAIDASQQLSMDDALTEEARVQGELGRAHDFREGVTAFGAKRAPVFKDR